MKNGKKNERLFSQSHPARVVVVYFCISALWIIISDLMVNDFRFFTGPTLLEITKGLAFVAATSVLLFFLIQQALSNLKKVNSELNNSLEHFNLITQHTSDVIWTLDLSEKRITYISPSVTQLLGYLPQDIIGKEVQSIFSKDTSEVINKEVFNQLGKYEGINNEKNFCTLELKQKCLDGTNKDTELVINFIKNNDGKITELLGITRDISLKKQYENELIKSRQQYQELFDKNPLPMWIFEIDTLKFLHVNKAACEHYGYTYEEFMGMTILDVRPFVDRSEVLAVSKTLKNEPQRTSIWNHIKKSGEKITVEITTYNFLYNNKGARLVLINDITERIKAQKELEESQHLLSSITETVPVSIYIVDVEKRKNVYSNKATAKLVGYTTEELIEMGDNSFEQLIYPEDLPLFEDDYATLISVDDNEIREKEYRMLHKSGSLHWYHSWEIVFQRNKLGNPVLVLGAVEDITVMKEAESFIKQANETLEQRVKERTRDLEEANNELEAFTYSVSHDLRAPLRAISGFSKIINDDYGDKLDEEGIDLLNEVITNSHKMSRLIDDLLTFSRIGKKDVVKSNINMNELVKNTFNEIKKDYANKDFQLNMNTLPDAIGDYSMLKQVIYNLLSNAAKFSSCRDVIIISFTGQSSEEKNTYCIEDNGVGFNPKFYNKLFKVFQRLHSAETFEGTGVGLAIVHRIITKHSGKVWAESELDKGSKFYFYLPNN